jgi:glycosyltransferase involved in cell wall biosynthesis
MAMTLRRSGSPLVVPDHGPSVAVLTPQRARLAIVSTRNKLCGIAAYTKALERQLSDLFDITVFDLDQYLLRGRHKRVRALGDRHIEEICSEFAGFDAVNLQLEFGTLGRSTKDIHRRFCWIVDAAPRLSVTFHTLKRPATFPWLDFLSAIITLKWRRADDMRAYHRREQTLSEGIAAHLRRAQRRKPIDIIVHNRRDLSDAAHLLGLKNVHHHPLAFLSATEIETIAGQAKRQRFPLIEPLQDACKLVGVFGFLNNYKGFGTVIRALHQLPPDYHLLIFGGTHPNEIQPHQPLHPYIASLLEEGHVDATLYDQIAAGSRQSINLALDIERHFADLVGGHPRDLSGRIHFMGAVEDEDFLAGMAMCDVVVMPYLEVGQSSSGPISQAVELGCRVIASRTHTFLEFAQYHPNAVEFFDIGNHLELAERIVARPQYAARREPSRYTVETNKAVYLAANSVPAGLPRFRRRAQPARPQVKAAE